jgi:hypothetical protein
MWRAAWGGAGGHGLGLHDVRLSLAKGHQHHQVLLDRLRHAPQREVVLHLLVKLRGRRVRPERRQPDGVAVAAGGNRVARVGAGLGHGVEK